MKRFLFQSHTRCVSPTRRQEALVGSLQSPCRGEVDEGCSKVWIVTLASPPTSALQVLVFKLLGVVTHGGLQPHKFPTTTPPQLQEEGSQARCRRIFGL